VQFFSISNFFADVSSKIIALANPGLSQPDMEQEMFLPLSCAYIPSFTICHVLPDLPGHQPEMTSDFRRFRNFRSTPFYWSFALPIE
jgi:hypothetical protein